MHMIYDLETLIEELKKANEYPYKQKRKHIYLRPVNRKWRNDHNLCIRNYGKMKESRKRIIKQRDNLKKQNIHLIKRIEQLEEYSKLAEENADLYRSLKSANAKIQKLERKLDHAVTEKSEYSRRYHLIQQIFNGVK